MKTLNVTPETFEILKSYNLSLNDIKNAISGSRETRQYGWENQYAWSCLMRLADSLNHFAGSIIEDALNGRNISDKQAWVVAFFAKKNGLLK